MVIPLRSPIAIRVGKNILMRRPTLPCLRAAKLAGKTRLGDFSRAITFPVRYVTHESRLEDAFRNEFDTENAIDLCRIRNVNYFQYISECTNEESVEEDSDNDRVSRNFRTIRNSHVAQMANNNSRVLRKRYFSDRGSTTSI